MTATVLSRSPAETMALARRLGSVLRAGDVVVLSGDLGAGKTVFAKGIAAALGVTDTVVSPTFTIVREYAGTPPLVHVDVYRIDRLQELHDLGFDDLVGGDAVTVVEWGDRIGNLLPADHLEVRIEWITESADAGSDDHGPADGDERRLVHVAATGRSWAARADALAALVDAGEPGTAAS
jgi:tRNA threonylcarbamoyladenosine biosynthesis protein TsaE